MTYSIKDNDGDEITTVETRDDLFRVLKDEALSYEQVNGSVELMTYNQSSNDAVIEMGNQGQAHLREDSDGDWILTWFVNRQFAGQLWFFVNENA